jgi:hypothetical protein
MTLEEIKEKISPFLETALSGGDTENPKLDFKRQWYNLKDPENIGGFLIDVASIVNTLGLDGFIIIGLDEKTRIFRPSRFSDSGLRDNSDIMKLIAKHVESIFTVNTFDFEFKGNSISVIHIPPSNNIPHVIKYCKKDGREINQAIYTRKGTSNHLAGKYDLELMFHYRQYLIPEYLILTSFHCSTLNVSDFPHHDDHVELYASVVMDFENLGRRAVSIISISLDLFWLENTLPQYRVNLEFDISGEPIVIQSGELASRTLEQRKVFPHGKVNLGLRDELRRNKGYILTKIVHFNFSNGQQYDSQLTISGLDRR